MLRERVHEAALPTIEGALHSVSEQDLGKNIDTATSQVEEIDNHFYPDIREYVRKDPNVVLHLQPEHIKVLRSLDGRSDFPRDPDLVQELRDSIIREGILDPLQVMLGEDGEAVLTKGFGRLDVVKKLMAEGVAYPGQPTIPVIIDQTTHDRAFIRGIHHNIKASSLSPIDIAVSIQRLKGEPHNLNQAAISKELGLSPGSISQHIGYLKLPPRAQEMMHNGTLSTYTARDLLQLESMKEMEVEVAKFEQGLKAGIKKSGLAVKTRASVRDKLKAKGKKSKLGKAAGSETTSQRRVSELRALCEEYQLESQYGKVALVFKIVLGFIDGKGAGDGRSYTVKKLEEILGRSRK